MGRRPWPGLPDGPVCEVPTCSFNLWLSFSTVVEWIPHWYQDSRVIACLLQWTVNFQGYPDHSSWLSLVTHTHTPADTHTKKPSKKSSTIQIISKMSWFGFGSAPTFYGFFCGSLLYISSRFHENRSDSFCEILLTDRLRWKLYLPPLQEQHR